MSTEGVMTLLEEDEYLVDVDIDADIPCEARPPDGKTAVARIMFRCPIPLCDSKGYVFLCQACLDLFIQGQPAMSVCSIHGPQWPIPERII